MWVGISVGEVLVGVRLANLSHGFMHHRFSADDLKSVFETRFRRLREVNFSLRRGSGMKF